MKSKPGASLRFQPVESAIADVGPLAGLVMPMDPNLMVMTPAPVPRHPTPVSTPSPIARPVGIIWLVAHLDINPNRIRGTRECAHAEQSSKKQRKFLHICLLRLDLDDLKPALFNQRYAS